MPAAASHEDIYHIGAGNMSNGQTSNDYSSSSSSPSANLVSIRSACPSSSSTTSSSPASLPPTSSNPDCVMFKGSTMITTTNTTATTGDKQALASLPSYYCNLHSYNDNNKQEDLFINNTQTTYRQDASRHHHNSSSRQSSKPVAVATSATASSNCQQQQQQQQQHHLKSLSTREINSSWHQDGCNKPSNHISSLKKQYSSPLSSSLNSHLHKEDQSESTMNFFYLNDDIDNEYHIINNRYNNHKHNHRATNNCHDHHHQHEHHLSNRSSMADFDTLMLLYGDDDYTAATGDPSPLLTTRCQDSPLMLSSPLTSSGANMQYLTIEELKVTRNSCWLCGCNWQQDHVSLDCPECGGYALTRPCPKCDGKCEQIWQRNLNTTHDSHKASWTGQCSMNGRCSSMETRTYDIGGNSVKPLTAKTVTDNNRHANNRQQQQTNTTGRKPLVADDTGSNGCPTFSTTRRSSSCCSSAPSSVVSSDSEL